MAKITVRGHEINVNETRDSFDRRAVQYRNNIIATLKKINITEDKVNVELLPFAFKKADAKAEWQLDGNKMYFDYGLGSKFVDNLFIVQKIIELEVESVLSGKKDKADFIKEFLEKESPSSTDSFNANKRQSENLSDRQKFMKMNPSAKMIIKDQE